MPEERSGQLGRGEIVSAAMVGYPVHTSEGEHIGDIKEVRGAVFKVNARMQPDYWLQTQFVRSTANDRVTMEFKKDDLGDYKVEEPAGPESRVADLTHPSPEGGPARNPAAAEIRNVDRPGT